MTFQTDTRAAAVTLLGDYAASADVKLQVYPGRPRTINPPIAFIDRVSERFEYSGPTIYRRTPSVEVVVIHGLFDSKDAADQKDAFADGFFVWQLTRYHSAGANTLFALVESEDDPNFVPDWLPPEQQRTYYATRLTLEGFASGA